MTEKGPTEAEVLKAFALHQRKGLKLKELKAKVRVANRNLMQDFAQKTGIDYTLIEKELGDLKYIDVLGLDDADYCLFHLKRCWHLPGNHKVTKH